MRRTWFGGNALLLENRASAREPAVGVGQLRLVWHRLARLGTRPNLAWLLFSALTWIGVALYLGFSWSGYAERYATLVAEGFSKGSTRLVEITLIREDAENLACASDTRIEGLGCGYASDQRSARDLEDARLLRPYNTVNGELFLGAGLWSSRALPRKLPSARFTVVCNYQVSGVLRSAALRWAKGGTFDALSRSLPVGVLKNCEIPR